jgi:hypothetical protein
VTPPPRRRRSKRLGDTEILGPLEGALADNARRFRRAEPATISAGAYAGGAFTELKLRVLQSTAAHPTRTVLAAAYRIAALAIESWPERLDTPSPAIGLDGPDVVIAIAHADTVTAAHAAARALREAAQALGFDVW